MHLAPWFEAVVEHLGAIWLQIKLTVYYDYFFYRNTFTIYHIAVTDFKKNEIYYYQGIIC